MDKSIKINFQKQYKSLQIMISTVKFLKNILNVLKNSKTCQMDKDDYTYLLYEPENKLLSLKTIQICFWFPNKYPHLPINAYTFFYIFSKKSCIISICY